MYGLSFSFQKEEAVLCSRDFIFSSSLLLFFISLIYFNFSGEGVVTIIREIQRKNLFIFCCDPE